MDAYNFVNGIRTDTVNDLNYTRLIHDGLYVGLLSRNVTAWGNCVLIGIEYPSAEIVADIDPIENLDLSNLTDEAYYVALFNTDYDETDTMYTTTDYTVYLWKVLRINSKWILLENTSITVDLSTTAVSEGISYNDFRNNISIGNDNYVMNIYNLTTVDDWANVATSTLLNTDYTYIRMKNSDLDFYDANKTVYLSPCGMGYPVTGFEDLVLLENSKDSTSIKIVNVPDSTIAKLTSGELNLTGRIFDVVDTQTDKILIKGLIYDTFISLNNNSLLKFVYPTQNGDKVVLATKDLYENIYQIYPDYTVNLLTEIINDNTPPGIDVTQCMDNYLYESLFLLATDINQGMDDLNFINTIGAITDVNFVSLANERNRLYSGANGFVLDNSVFIGTSYGVGGANWPDIKEYNLNKLLLNWTMNVTNSATAPASPTVNDLWYDTTNSVLRIHTEVMTDSSDASYVDESESLIAIATGDWTTNIQAGDVITVSGCEDGGGANNQSYIVDTIDYDSSVVGHTAIYVTDNTGMTDEILDADPDETIEVWREIPNDVRQIAVFYMSDFGGPAEFIDLIYLANINKISVTNDINIQLII